MFAIQLSYKGSVHEYTVPVIKVQEYTKSVIFQKKLFFLLPFYIMRYEKEKEEISDVARLMFYLVCAPCWDFFSIQSTPSK